MVKLRLLWYSITLLHPKYTVEAILLLWVEMLLKLKTWVEFPLWADGATHRLRLQTWVSFHSGRMGPPTSWKPSTAFLNNIP
jgi:hypothetical protein